MKGKDEEVMNQEKEAKKRRIKIKFSKHSSKPKTEFEAEEEQIDETSGLHPLKRSQSMTSLKRSSSLASIKVTSLKRNLSKDRKGKSKLAEVHLSNESIDPLENAMVRKILFFSKS